MFSRMQASTRPALTADNWGASNPMGTPSWASTAGLTPMNGLFGGASSGGPNMPTQVDSVLPQIGPMEPADPVTRAICGLPPVPTGSPSSKGGWVKPSFGGGDNPTPSQQSSLFDLFNRSMPSFGGGNGSPFGIGMAPSMPQQFDFGLGLQQMGTGNPMGGMNNWFSNFTAPRPPAPTAPAPTMPMKGMFGIR